MIQDIFKDSDGKFCAAKTSFLICLFTFLPIIVHHEFNAIHVNYQGMASVLAVPSAIYFGRAHTKARNREGEDECSHKLR